MSRLLLASLGLALLLPVAATGADRPNLVVLLCDDLGYGDLGEYGHPVIRTPHLDRLAAEGIRLTRCYAAAPVCSPSRAGLLTGRNPARLGIRDWIPEGSPVHLKSDEVTIAERLRTAGYRTGIVGKWHVAGTLDGSQPTPNDQGFDHAFVTQNNAAPSHHDPVNFVRNGRPVGPLEGESSTLIVDEALRFLDATPDQPFALFVCFHAPHEPVAAPESITSRYAAIDDATRRIYYGSVALVDQEVGRLVGELDRRGLGRNTLVFFTSDNGPETLRRYKGAERSHGSPGPLRGMKLHVHEGGFRVPGILRWPGRIPGGQVVDKPVSSLDLLPTACELAGVEPPQGRPLDGVSLTPLFRGEALDRMRPLYWEYDSALGRPWTRALLVKPWKLLADAELERFALYQLDEDPAESDDRSAREPERVRALARTMRQLHREMNAEAPVFPKPAR